MCWSSYNLVKSSPFYTLLDIHMYICFKTDNLSNIVIFLKQI